MVPPAEMVLTLCSAPLEPWEKACTPEPSRGPFPQAAPSPVLPHPLLTQWFPLPSGLLPFLTNSLACFCAGPQVTSVRPSPVLRVLLCFPRFP